MRILKFSAVWCPGCLVMKNVWNEVLKEFSNIDITEYDYDLDEDMVEKYNIGDKLPVIIMVDENDKEMKRIIGEKKKEELIKFIKER